MEAIAATRMTADERRESILVAAADEFAVRGLHGASTDAIARQAGISQPYLFRLFGTKKELFVATERRCLRRTLETFQRAAEGKRGEEALQAIGAAYGELVKSDPTMLRLQLQGYAASAEDTDIRTVIKDGYGDLVAYVERVSGAGPRRISSFFAKGMLINVIAAMQLAEDPEPWAQRLVEGCREEDPQ